MKTIIKVFALSENKVVALFLFVIYEIFVSWIVSWTSEKFEIEKIYDFYAKIRFVCMICMSRQRTKPICFR